jgi:hypothetical protein
LESYKNSINWFSNATPNNKHSLTFDIKTNCRIFKEHIRASWLACHEAFLPEVPRERGMIHDTL